MKKSILRGICKTIIIAFAVNFLLGGIALAENQDVADRVNINEAAVKELAKLPGIGKRKAEAIVAYRAENGKFNSIDDLKKVDGIGKKTFEKIKDQITLGAGS
jgi:competence protein ComEA